ncbi:MAG: deaminase domain-containing protein [Candidatus Thiodiazotropha sp.]
MCKSGAAFPRGAWERENTQVNGTVNLFTERLNCQSCGDVVLDFRNRYPNIQLNVFTRD